MVGIDEWLERLSWIALISLPFMFILGGYVVLRRLRPFEQDIEDVLHATATSRLLELVVLMQEHSNRDARATVLIDIAGREQNKENWWEDDARLHRAAETLCASYDYIAGVINFESGRIGQFFLETWGEDVIRVHDVLRRYLDFRRNSGAASYNEFTWLAQEAKLIHDTPPAPESQHPIRTVLRHLRS